MRFNVSDFDLSFIKTIPILKRRAGNPGTRNTNFYYKDIICAFDIETTRIKIGEKKISKNVYKDNEVSIMYVWQFQIGLNITVIGRTWEEFKLFMQKLAGYVKTEQRILIYVHNLSYEWNWLRDNYVLGNYIDNDSVFILKKRKILKFLCFNNKIEFRCSYIHSNMSLDEFTSKMNVEHKKLSGDKYDYDKKRYPWTELTEYEMNYICNDVQGLVECIYKEMEIDNDDAYSIPLTSTGYVRREIKESKKENECIYLNDLSPDYETYKMLREAFRGGNCHANPYYANRKFDGKIASADRSSSYPDVQMNCLFPSSPYMEVSKKKQSVDDIYHKIEMGYGILARLKLYNVRLTDNYWGCPYISLDKCRNVIGNEEYPLMIDNGRIRQCAYLEITVLDVDLKIILEKYGGEYTIDEIIPIDYKFCYLAPMPEPIKSVIRKFYELKTRLKGDETQAVVYMKSKNKLNAIYGNSAQDPGKAELFYEPETEDIYNSGYIDKKTKEKTYLKKAEDKKDIEKVKKYNDEIYKKCFYKMKTVLPYQHGCYTTAYARYYLELAIRECEKYYAFIYCDTDSVYYDMEKPVSFEEYNKERIESSTKNKAYAEDSKGKIHYMGVMEMEHGKTEEDIITCFKTLGAKKYAYIDKKHGLVITIAGVSKRLGAHELLVKSAERENCHPLDLLSPGEFLEDGTKTDGFIFVKAGGNEIEYIDKSPGWMNIDGHNIYVTTCAVIKPSTYELSLADDYKKLLENPKVTNRAAEIFSGIKYDD